MSALEEQKKLDKEVSEFHSQQSALEAQRRQEKIELREQLDKVLADKKNCEERKARKEKAEEEERTMFANAKKVRTYTIS